jgi:acyl carrier protein
MPAPSDVQADVLRVLRDVSGRSVTAGASGDLAADFGFDSLKTLEFVAALEDHFDVSIPLNDLPAMKSVAQVVDHMSALLSGQRKVDGEPQDSAGSSRISGGPR